MTESMTRKALQDYTFADGTFIPAGTTISAPSHSVHHDGQFYDNPRQFDPFRFSRMRDDDGEGTRHQMVSTSTDYIPFGHGRHAWYVLNPPVVHARVLIGFDP